MASTFDIRFARSEGLAALFEAPANSFRWKGAGKLSVDAQGISIAVKRGLLSLFGRKDRRIAADQLTQVYREGEALRIEYHIGSARSVMPVWARDSETAARIVKLLPTARTVELDQVTEASRYRLDWRPLALLLAVAIALAVGVIWQQRSGAPGLAVPVADAPVQDQASIDAQVPNATPGNLDAGKANRVASPVQSGDLRRATQAPAAVGEPKREADTQAPRSVSASPAADPEAAAGIPESSTGYLPEVNIPVAEYAQGSASLMWVMFDRQSGPNAVSWWEFTVRLHTTPQFQHPDLWALRENMLAISRAWRAGDQELARRLTESMRRNF